MARRHTRIVSGGITSGERSGAADEFPAIFGSNQGIGRSHLTAGKLDHPRQHERRTEANALLFNVAFDLVDRRARPFKITGVQRHPTARRESIAEA